MINCKNVICDVLMTKQFTLSCTGHLKKADFKSLHSIIDGDCLNFTYVGEYDPCTDGDLEHCYEKFPHFFNKELKE